ncbi:MAG: C40 family peptidase [Pseudonocardiales bacterium]
MQQQLGTLAVQNSQLVETFNQAQADVDAKLHKADHARLAANQAQATYRKARVQLTQTVAAQYEGGSFSATGALLSSNNGQSYLDQLNTLSVMSSHTAQMIARATAAKKSSSEADHQAKSLLATATAKRDALGKKKDAVQQQIDKYTTLLATLTAAQRAAFLRTISPPAPAAAVAKVTVSVPAHGGTAQGRQAAEFAIAQVGKPYVFAASGPDAYDCSGLTMAAWASVGVALPHSAEQQYGYGTHVALSQLLPGDLVFLYSPIGHVEIYIGNGMVVSAPQPGESVKIVALNGHLGDIVGATRLP